MGSNYYIMKEEKMIHIGKVSTESVFTWAMHPSRLIGQYVGEEVIDEFGNEFLWVDFLSMINNKQWDLEKVGTEFC